MEKEIKIGGIWYLLDIDEQKATVIKSQDKEYSGKIIIPSSFFHEGITYSVTTIGEQAFRSCGRLHSIAIPDSVIKVEPKAFEGCLELTEVHVNSIVVWCNIEFSGNFRVFNDGLPFSDSTLLIIRKLKSQCNPTNPAGLTTIQLCILLSIHHIS
jgi:hypothetical protein